MPVFQRDDVRILYIHVPKTGGSSLERFFVMNKFHMQYYDAGRRKVSLYKVRLCSPQHMHAEMIQSIFDISKFDYVFMTVRNPFSRLHSEFKMRQSYNKNLSNINTWISQTFKQYRRNRHVFDNHIRPQSEFLVPNCQVRRLEDGYEKKWVSALSERLSLKFDHEEVGHIGRSSQAKNHTMSEEIVAAVRDFYRKDFLSFGYSDLDGC